MVQPGGCGGVSVLKVERRIAQHWGPMWELGRATCVASEECLGMLLRTGSPAMGDADKGPSKQGRVVYKCRRGLDLQGVAAAK